MTVISAIISTHCIAISTDSLLTVYNSATNSYKVVETKRPKIVRVERFLGAFSYWGLAAKSQYSTWTTYNWLVQKSAEANQYGAISDYADYIGTQLENELNRLNIPIKSRGIGIHFIGYETWNGFKIPELFLITNFTDSSYGKVGRVSVSRHLFPTLPDNFKANKQIQSQLDKQLLVRDFLQTGKIFIFNNGDPEFFNPVSEGYITVMKLAKTRNLIKNSNDIEIFRGLARRPIEIVAKAQKDFYKADQIIVGGRIHDLVIEKTTGRFSSTSGI